MERLIILSFLLFAPLTSVYAQAEKDQLSLTQDEGSHFARLALKCVRKEYPNKPDHTINDSDDVRSPKAMHPAFYGCFDWHSTVHGHWMLVHLLKLFPNLPEAREIRNAGYNPRGATSGINCAGSPTAGTPGVVSASSTSFFMMRPPAPDGSRPRHRPASRSGP